MKPFDKGIAMLRRIRDMEAYRLHATDGDIGHLEEFYFEDRHWRIRYFVVEIGTWLHSKRVLIAPSSVMGVDDGNRAIQTPFTKEQVQQSADVRTNKPVALQHSRDYYLYLGWPYYVGLNASNVASEAADRESTETPSSESSFQRTADENLRSSKVVGHYHIMAVDGEIGHIEDFIVDDETWSLRYAVADTRNWRSGKKVLLPTDWILWVSWAESNAYVSLTKQLIATAPEYDSQKPLTREFETELYNHYKRLPYWEHRKAVG
jgi:PRC-barrel domain protein